MKTAIEALRYLWIGAAIGTALALVLFLALALAGLLAPQADRVVAAYRGCVEVERPIEEGWAAPVLRAAR